jgi:hypothetical protein
MGQTTTPKAMNEHLQRLCTLLKLKPEPVMVPIVVPGN